jgi:PHD/YefM family antitoxin component YafN of YafNO toxin-antitoxin module
VSNSFTLKDRDQLARYMERLYGPRIDAHIARIQIGQIMDPATKNNERFIVDRRGQPAVVIMSVQDFIRTAASLPGRLEKAWTGAKRRRLDALTPADVDDEIAAYRRDAR